MWFCCCCCCCFIFYILAVSVPFWSQWPGKSLYVRLQLVLIETALCLCRLLDSYQLPGSSDSREQSSTQQSLHSAAAALLVVLAVERSGTDRRPTDQHCSTVRSCGDTAACKCEEVCRDKNSSLRATFQVRTLRDWGNDVDVDKTKAWLQVGTGRQAVSIGHCLNV